MSFFGSAFNEIYRILFSEPFFEGPQSGHARASRQQEFYEDFHYVRQFNATNESTARLRCHAIKRKVT